MTRRGLPVGPPPREPELSLAPPTEDSPFLRRRVRKRLRPRRRGWSARLVILVQASAILILLSFGAWTISQRVIASESLRVDRVEVRGSHFLSEGEVRELLGPTVGENILFLDIAALKLRLRSSPWVADATVIRTLPNVVRVEIRERVPLALAEVDRLYLMDGDGALVDIYGPRTGVFDLPIVRGLLGVDEASRRGRARRAGTLLADLPSSARRSPRCSSSPTATCGWCCRVLARCCSSATRRTGAASVTFLSLRRELAEKAPGAEHFDLRFRGRIYARGPKSGSSKPASPTVGSRMPVSHSRIPRPETAGLTRPPSEGTLPSEPGVRPSLPTTKTQRSIPPAGGALETRPAPSGTGLDGR